MFTADTLILLQSTQVEGEEESLAAVKANRVFVLDRLGYPGLRGRNMLLEDVLKILK